MAVVMWPMTSSIISSSTSCSESIPSPVCASRAASIIDSRSPAGSPLSRCAAMVAATAFLRSRSDLSRRRLRGVGMATGKVFGLRTRSLK